MQIPDRRTTPRRKTVQVTDEMRKRRYRHPDHRLPAPPPTLRAKVAEFVLERQCRAAERARAADD